jgi:predicted esterase
MIAAGRRDPYAEHGRVEALAARLTQAGAAVDLRWSEADHSLMPSDFKAVAEWISTWRSGLPARPK